MTSKIPVSTQPTRRSTRPDRRRRSRRAPALCLLAVLALHGLALRDVAAWARTGSAETTNGPTAPAARSVQTRVIRPVEPAPVAAAQTAPADTPAPVPSRPPAGPRLLAAASAPAPVPVPAAVAEPASALPEPRPAAPAGPTVHAPPPIRLDYKLHRGAIGGDARLDWRHDGRRYTLDLEGQLPLIGTLMHQHSEGGFDAAGLAPLRYTEKRLRRSERAVNFNRPADGQPGRITFSATTGEAPLRTGAQDRVSWMVQLAARLAGTQTLPAAGSRIEMDVASAGGDVQGWHFVLQGRAADGSWHWRRDTGEPDATQAEVWTDPGAGHWPRRVRLTERQGEPIELVLQRR